MNHLKKLLLLFVVFNINFLYPSNNERFKYFSNLDNHEKKSIQFIITTLGSKSTLSLMWHKSELEKAGNEILFVHPLKFWKEVLTNKNLIPYLKKIGSLPKKRMIEDFSKSFQKVDEMGLITENQLKDFSDSTGYPYQKLLEIVNKKDWKSLVRSFFE